MSETKYSEPCDIVIRFKSITLKEVIAKGDQVCSFTKENTLIVKNGENIVAEYPSDSILGWHVDNKENSASIY